MSAKRKQPELIMKSDKHYKEGTPVLIYNGVKIAERGQPNSPQARQWVVLEPGYKVYGDGPITVEYNGARVH
jgi:hypothetical protein